MIRISVRFDFHPSLPNGRTDYMETREVNEALLLDAIVPRTNFPTAGHYGFKPPAGAFLGKWSSVSPYLGKESRGMFYITDIDFPEPGRWSGIYNPVGLFFDSVSDSQPFLMLYGFSLLAISPKPRGRGKLENVAPIKMDQWVDWSLPHAQSEGAPRIGLPGFGM